MLVGLLSCLGSPRIRIMTGSFCTVLLLGLIGGMIYVGVVEKVNWKITGGYIGKANVYDMTKLSIFFFDLLT